MKSIGPENFGNRGERFVVSKSNQRLGPGFYGDMREVLPKPKPGF